MKSSLEIFRLFSASQKHRPISLKDRAASHQISQKIVIYSASAFDNLDNQ